MPPNPPREIFRFGIYEADAVSGELRKSGLRVRLQDQSFQVLLLLLQRPGELVSRDELHQQLWPADTFVDFDHGLNTVINKLREALGDSASNPRFVETLARRGYRFLAPVERVHSSNQSTNARSAGSPAPQRSGSASVSVLTRAEDVPSVRPRYVRLLFLLIQLMYLSFYILALARLTRIQEVLESAIGYRLWVTILVVLSALIGLPIRLYLISAVIFGVAGLQQKFARLFLPTLFLDELWAIAPFLLAPQIGFGLALAATAALIYVPFAQRTLLLMGERAQVVRPAP